MERWRTIDAKGNFYEKRDIFSNFLLSMTENKGVRVGGGLANSPYNIDKMFPILILRNSPITKLLTREAYSKNFNGGPQLTLFQLRQTVGIPGGLSVVKKVTYKWKPYIRNGARIPQPQMGDLPTACVIPSFAFSQTGFDYCAPLNTKDSRQTLQKTQVALFICFSKKAVDKGTVKTLTKDDCLDGDKQFTARRGMPQNIYSDNSKTFTATRGKVEFQRLLMDRDFK